MRSYLEQISDILEKPVVLERQKHPEILQTLPQFMVYIGTGEEKHEIARFCMIRMPGCCGVVLSYHALVHEQYQHKGIGNLLHRMRLQMAYDSGYTVMLCTDVERNPWEQSILKKNGWTKLLTFRNKRSGNDVGIHSYNVVNTGTYVGNTQARLAV